MSELNKESADQAGGDERAGFEAWLAQVMSRHFVREFDLAKYEDSGEYRYNPAADCWKAWQARAALASPPVADESPMAKMADALREKARQEQQAYQDRRNQATEWGPMPEGTEADRPISTAPVAHVAGDETSRYLEWAKDRSAWEMPVGTPVYYAALAQPSPAQAEAERPEVAEVAFVLRNIGAMDAEDIDGDNVDLRFEDAEGRDTGCDVSIVEYAEKAADLFEQHARIVGALRADRDSWAEQAEQRLADWDEMRKERDAALARVAELELKLDKSDYAYDNDRIHMRGLAARAIARAKVFDDGSDGADAESARSVVAILRELLAVGPAQAQHSVPAYVSYTTQPAESLAGIALRQLKDESRWVEIRDINAHAFPDMRSHSYYPAGSVIKLPAAAPGKEVGHE